MAIDTKLLTSITPSERQIAWQETGYYNFVHFGMNTVTGKEWGDGKTPPSAFNVPFADTDSWVKTFKESGSKGVIITAKHHDGFCLFKTAYTDYSVSNSPYQDGKGDIVKQVADSCKKYGLKFGFYLSPWDRHDARYGTDEYNAYFCNQLRELCKNYGEVFEVWFDGACGEGPNGKKQVYDFQTYYKIIRRYQPNAVIAISGPDVRWIGNEAGIFRKEEWSVVPSSVFDGYEIAEKSQHTEGASIKKMNAMDKDLGSRRVLDGITDLIWYPAECDVSILNKGWFFSKKKEFLGGYISLKKLRKIYYGTVGANATLLLNVPPDKSGNLPARAVKRLQKFGSSLKDDLGKPVKCKLSPLKISTEGIYYYEVQAKYCSPSRVELREDVTKGQRVESWELQYKSKGGSYQTLCTGNIIGFKTIKEARPVGAEFFRLIINSCREEPYVKEITLYK